MTQFVTTFNVRHSGGGNHQRLRNWVLCRRGQRPASAASYPPLQKSQGRGTPQSWWCRQTQNPGPPSASASEVGFPVPNAAHQTVNAPWVPTFPRSIARGISITNVPACHSNRSAEIGSIRVAFLAGTQTATSATAHRKIGVRMNAIGSHVLYSEQESR